MRCALCCINYHNCTNCMCHGCYFLNRINTSKYIGYLTYSYNLSILINASLKCFICERSILLTFKINKLCTCHSCCHLPWKHIAVMLHNRNCYLIACLKIIKSIAVSYKIKTFSCISCKYDFLC